MMDVEKLNLSAIRTVRVLRPLKAINRIPSMRYNTSIFKIKLFVIAIGSWWCSFWTHFLCLEMSYFFAFLSFSSLALLEYSFGLACWGRGVMSGIKLTLNLERDLFFILVTNFFKIGSTSLGLILSPLCTINLQMAQSTSALDQTIREFINVQV